MAEDGLITCYKGGLVLKGGSLVQKDIWVRAGRVVEPQELFFRDRRAPSFYFDCSNHIVAPGFIDVQINGANTMLLAPEFTYFETVQVGSVLTFPNSAQGVWQRAWPQLPGGCWSTESLRSAPPSSPLELITMPQ